MLANTIFADIFCYTLLSDFGWDWIIVIGAVEAGVATVAVTAVSILMTLHAVYNITANERVNYKRYKYLMDGKGAFYNPFNRGIVNNLKEFFLLVKPRTEQDVEILNI